MCMLIRKLVLVYKKKLGQTIKNENCINIIMKNNIIMMIIIIHDKINKKYLK